MSSGLDNCPLCGVSLIGGEIPEKDRHWFGNHTHFKREIGIVWNDRVREWKCPDCGGVWKR